MSKILRIDYCRDFTGAGDCKYLGSRGPWICCHPNFRYMDGGRYICNYIACENVKIPDFCPLEDAE